MGSHRIRINTRPGEVTSALVTAVDLLALARFDHAQVGCHPALKFTSAICTLDA